MNDKPQPPIVFCLKCHHRLVGKDGMCSFSKSLYAKRCGCHCVFPPSSETMESDKMRHYFIESNEGVGGCCNARGDDPIHIPLPSGESGEVKASVSAYRLGVEAMAKEAKHVMREHQNGVNCIHAAPCVEFIEYAKDALLAADSGPQLKQE